MLDGSMVMLTCRLKPREGADDAAMAADADADEDAK